VIAEWKSESTPIVARASDTIEYSRRLDDDSVATLEARGISVTQLSNSVVLFESFDSICRHFPADTAAEIARPSHDLRAA
jgi:hypothetical protein